MKKDRLPTISILTYTYNAEKTIGRCIESLLSQKYPIKNVEWIICDGGSTDSTKDILRRYEKRFPKLIKFYESPTEHKYAGNEGYSLFARKTNGELILFIEPSDALLQSNWLAEMAGILAEKKEISAVQSRIVGFRKCSAIGRYIASTGVNDPFAIPYSLNSQAIINLKKFIDKGAYYQYKGDINDFMYGGGSGFMIKRDDFFKNGGWIQDTDLFYRMAKNRCSVAVPKNLRIVRMHDAKLHEFLKEQAKKVNYYLNENYYGRDFYWFDPGKNNLKQNMKFIRTVLFNLLFVPGLLQGIKIAMREKQGFWLMHPIMLFVITFDYIFARGINFLREKREPGI